MVFGMLKRITLYKEELQIMQCSWKLNLELSSQKSKPSKVTGCTETLGLYSLYDFLSI